MGLSQNNEAPCAATPEAPQQTIDSPETLNFPDPLRQENRWMCYKISPDASEKTPISPLTGGHASSKDPATWTDFTTAQRYAARNGLVMGLAINNSLPGFNRLTAIDFDHVCAEGEAPPSWVADVCAELGSFTERSFSGTGFHALVYGDLPNSNNIVGPIIEANVHGGNQKVELFAHKMVAVTGECLPGLTTIKTATAEKLIEIGDRARAGFGRIKKPVASTSKLIVENDLAVLERGENPGGDASACDKRYVALLAEQGLSDAEIDTRFRDSARMRPKWDEIHSADKKTYGELTIHHVRKSHAAKLRGETSAAVEVNPDYWPRLFHTRTETVNAPPISFAIEEFLQEGGITMLGGLPGHGKTLIALAMVRALLEGTRLFGHFAVPSKSKRVIYLIPESGLSPFASRLKIFRLVDYVGEHLFYRTFSAADEENIVLTDPRIKKACEGADVFLDTAVRFMDGDENAASEQKVFARNLFALLKAGARTVTGLHHAPKSFEKDNYMSLENILRGSGDIGAMLAACWGIFQIDKSTNRLFVENTKARDFLPCDPFIIEGRPHIDTAGAFKMTHFPGLAGTLNKHKPRKSGRPEMPGKTWRIAEAARLRSKGKSFRHIGQVLGVDHKTVAAWLEAPNAA